MNIYGIVQKRTKLKKSMITNNMYDIVSKMFCSTYNIGNIMTYIIKKKYFHKRWHFSKTIIDRQKSPYTDYFIKQTDAYFFPLSWNY